MIPKLKWDDSYRPDRGKVLTKEQLEALPKYYRYSPEDENAVAARTLPGVHEKGAFFTRGSGHNKLGGYTEIPDEYQEVMDRLLRKHKAARHAVPAAIVEKRVGATLGVLTVGGWTTVSRVSTRSTTRKNCYATTMTKCRNALC